MPCATHNRHTYYILKNTQIQFDSDSQHAISINIASRRAPFCRRNNIYSVRQNVVWAECVSENATRQFTVCVYTYFLFLLLGLQDVSSCCYTSHSFGTIFHSSQPCFDFQTLCFVSAV